MVALGYFVNGTELQDKASYDRMQREIGFKPSYDKKQKINLCLRSTQKDSTKQKKMLVILMLLDCPLKNGKTFECS
jgi:hypothetical protein